MARGLRRLVQFVRTRAAVRRKSGFMRRRWRGLGEVRGVCAGGLCDRGGAPIHGFSLRYPGGISCPSYFQTLVPDFSQCGHSVSEATRRSDRKREMRRGFGSAKSNPRGWVWKSKPPGKVARMTEFILPPNRSESSEMSRGGSARESERVSIARKWVAMKLDARVSAFARMRLSNTQPTAKIKSSSKIKRRVFFILR